MRYIIQMMNHTKTLAIAVVMLASIAALIGAVGISIQQQQSAAAITTTDLENSGTNSKFKQKEKNNCSGFTVCCNVASQSIGLARIPLCAGPPPPAPPI